VGKADDAGRGGSKGTGARAVKLLSRSQWNEPIARTPVLPEAIPVGPLSALLSLFLAVFFPRDRGNVFRVDDAQDVLNDLPFGQFGEGPHAVDMGAKGHSNSTLAVPFKPESPKRQHGLAGRVDARGTACRNARASRRCNGNFSLCSC
jgi:hypothetical protein